MAEPLYKQNIWNRDEDQSVLEIYNVETSEHAVVAEIDDCIEAPNWTPDGKRFAFVTYRIRGFGAPEEE